MLQRLSQNLLIAIFLVVISTPLLIMLAGDQAEISAHEKRRLASFPAWHWDNRLLNDFPGEFTDYFDDRYGLREHLVEHSQRLKKRYFHKSPTSMVIRGEQDWLFFNEDGSLRDHIGLQPLNEDILRKWQQQLIDKRDWLQSIGIEYFFVPIPNKMTLYAEHLPTRIRSHSGRTMLDQLLDYLQIQGRYRNYTDLEPVFSRHLVDHPEVPLYFKTDTHWTSHGAFVAYRHIIQQLQQRLPQLEPPLDFGQVQRRYRSKDGDLADIIDMDRQLEEQTYDLVPVRKCASDSYSPLSSFASSAAYRLKPKQLPEINGCPEKSLTAVVVHDSFGAYLKPYLSESFRRVIFMHSYDLVGMEAFLRREQPDLYLDLRVERSVKHLLRPDEKLQAALGRRQS